MADVILKSERQIQADLLASIMEALSINDINPGSVLDILTQAKSQEVFSQYVQIAKIASLRNVNNLTGEDLDNYAFEFGLTRSTAQKATGKINILRSSTFTKKFTKLYRGDYTAYIGSNVLKVNDASTFPNASNTGDSFTIVIGRGTANEERVSYSNVADGTPRITVETTPIQHYAIQLDSNLRNNHLFGEEIVLLQGDDIIIPFGTIVNTSSTGISNAISFTINRDTVLLSGEDKVENVDITAVEAGSSGNIIIRGIDGTGAFDSPIFPGSRAENLNKFTTGMDRQTDNELRDQIRSHTNNLTAGIRLAIKNALIGLVDEETSKRVVSANIVNPLESGDPVEIYIDDGTGFEPSFESQGLESVIKNANGGEKRFSLRNSPMVQAQLETENSEPFDLSTSNQLIVEIGKDPCFSDSEVETITFAASDFASINVASAEEIIGVINNRSTHLKARTSKIGKNVIIQAKDNSVDSIKILKNLDSNLDANSELLFPEDKKDSLSLYLNGKKLNDKTSPSCVISDEVITLVNGIKEIPVRDINIYEDAVIDNNVFRFYLTNLNLLRNPASTSTLIFNLFDNSVESDYLAPESIITALNSLSISSNRIFNASIVNNKIKISSDVCDFRIGNDDFLDTSGNNTRQLVADLGLSDYLNVTVRSIDKDYTLNKDAGILELTNPLKSGDNLDVGKSNIKPSIRSNTSASFTYSSATTIDFRIDEKPISVDINVGTYTVPQMVFTLLNDSFNENATAYAVGEYIEVISNNRSLNSSIEVETENTSDDLLGFPRYEKSIVEETFDAFIISENTNTTEDLGLSYGDTFSLIVDEDEENNNFFINLTLEDMPSSVANEGEFTIPGLIKIFTKDTDLVGFNIIRRPDQTNPQISEITSYNSTTGVIEVSPDFSNNSISTNTTLGIVPKTMDNLISLLKNIRISPLSLVVDIEKTYNGVDGTEILNRLQLSSKNKSSKGAIQITGGSANDILLFHNRLIKGKSTYEYFTGLVALVNKTVYGDDSDPISFPGVGSPGTIFQILTPTVSEVLVGIKVDLEPNISLTLIETDIKSAVDNYINTLEIGQDLVVEEIRSSIIRIFGVKDVALTSPTRNKVASENVVFKTNFNLITVVEGISEES